METREELENELEKLIVTADYLGCNDRELKNEILKLIPEVLREILPKEDNMVYRVEKQILLEIKQKAKEFGFII